MQFVARSKGNCPGRRTAVSFSQLRPPNPGRNPKTRGGPTSPPAAAGVPVIPVPSSADDPNVRPADRSRTGHFRNRAGAKTHTVKPRERGRKQRRPVRRDGPLFEATGRLTLIRPDRRHNRPGDSLDEWSWTSFAFPPRKFTSRLRLCPPHMRATRRRNAAAIARTPAQ